MKVGDLVEVKDPYTTGLFPLSGLITDAIEDANGFWMYEVTSLEPSERGWFSDLQLRAINDEHKE